MDVERMKKDAWRRKRVNGEVATLFGLRHPTVHCLEYFVVLS